MSFKFESKEGLGDEVQQYVISYVAKRIVGESFNQKSNIT